MIVRDALADELPKISLAKRYHLGQLLLANSGAQSSPTFAGDTIYACSDVLERAVLPGRSDVGALRPRLVALKNADPARRVDPAEAREGRARPLPPERGAGPRPWLLSPARR